MAGWRFHATRLNGDGTETLLANDLPFSDVQITKTLSGPDELTAKLTPEHMCLKDDNGAPTLLPWSSAIYASAGTIIRFGGIITALKANGPDLTVTAAGFVSFLDGVPWTNTTRKYYGEDPAKVIRDIWLFAQTHPKGNIGLTLPGGLKTTAKVGERRKETKNAKGETVEQAVDEPVLLAQYATEDLSKVFDDMLEAGSIDYVEKHEAQDDGSITHRLDMASPRLGRRRTDVGFVVGVNVIEIPEVDLHVEDYLSEAVVWGAGEGEKMITAHARNDAAKRLRRVKVFQNKNTGRQATARSAAELYLRRYSQDSAADVESLLVIDHPVAPLFSYELGDEVWLSGDSWWGGKLGMWVRVLGITLDPEGQAASVKVARAGRN